MLIEIRHEQFVGLSVVLGDRTVLEGLQLNGFAPRSSWQLAVAASSADDLEGTDEHWINDLRVVSGSLLERADVPVRVSLNGQQLHPPVPLTYTLRALPAVLNGTPRLGSTAGGTLVQLFGLRMASAGAPSRVCRFGDAAEVHIVAGVHVPATLHHSGASGDTVHCLAPAAAAPGALSVRVSVNGLQFSLSAFSFTYHSPLVLSAVSPSRGAVAGGTLIELTGTLPRVGVALGIAPRCRFRVPAGDEVAQPASFTTVGLRCRTPDAADYLYVGPSDLPVDAALAVSISNGDEFHGAAPSAAPLFFTYIAPHAVTGITPSIGPDLGGTRVDLSGTGLAASATLRCRFGRTVVAGNASSASAMQCAAPALAEAVGLYEHPIALPGAALSTGGDGGGDGVIELRGIAHTGGATIVLTRAHAHTAGAAILPASNARLGPGEAPAAFRLTFEVRAFGRAEGLGGLGGGGGGDEGAIAGAIAEQGEGGEGFSVSYGLLPSAGVLGERGGGNGLRIAFRTRPTPSDVAAAAAATAAISAAISAGMEAGADALESAHGLVTILLGGRVLHERLLGASDPRLRGDAYRLVLVSYEASYGLIVSVDGTRIVDGLALPGWAPRPGWRLAVGARCSTAVDHHSIRRLTLQSGRLLTGGAVDVDVALNGIDFAPGVRFPYFGIEHVAPTRGPAAGGTRAYACVGQHCTLAMPPPRPSRRPAAGSAMCRCLPRWPMTPLTCCASPPPLRAAPAPSRSPSPLPSASTARRSTEARPTFRTLRLRRSTASSLLRGAEGAAFSCTCMAPRSARRSSRPTPMP